MHVLQLITEEILGAMRRVELVMVLLATLAAWPPYSFAADVAENWQSEFLAVAGSATLPGACQVGGSPGTAAVGTLSVSERR